MLKLCVALTVGESGVKNRDVGGRDVGGRDVRFPLTRIVGYALKTKRFLELEEKCQSKKSRT